MIKIESLIFSDKMIVNGGAFVLVNVGPLYNQKEIRTGTEVTVALTGRKFAKIVVAVEEQVACSPFNSMEIKKVSFNDFVGSFKRNEESDYIFRATAKSFKLIRDE